MNQTKWLSIRESFNRADEKKQDHTKETFEIGDKVIEASPSVKLLGIQIDVKLNFNLPVTNICRSAAN